MTRAPGTHRPLRVAILDHAAELGGAELALARMLDALDRTRVEPVVVLFSPGPLADRLVSAGHRVEVVPLDEGLRAADRFSGAGHAVDPRRVVAGAGFVRRLVRALRHLHVDVVHTTSLKADLAGAVAAPLVRRPLVWHVHDRIAADYLPDRTVGLVRALARRVPRAVVANSQATAATLPRARNLSVVYPGLAPEQVAVAPRQAQPPGAPVVGLVGRISPTKGQLVLVRAARHIVDVRQDARFRLIGSPVFGAEEYEAQVRSEVERLGLDGAVEFTGFVDDPRVELASLSVCVHAATVPEPFGQVVTEAMAWGVPVVATRGGGVDEIVGDRPQGEDTALLVQSEDDKALAAAVLSVLERPGAALSRAARAHDDVARRFLAGTAAESLTRVWEQAAGARRRSAAEQL